MSSSPPPISRLPASSQFLSMISMFSTRAILEVLVSWLNSLLYRAIFSLFFINFFTLCPLLASAMSAFTVAFTIHDNTPLLLYEIILTIKNLKHHSHLRTPHPQQHNSRNGNQRTLDSQQNLDITAILHNKRNRYPYSRSKTKPTCVISG